MYANAVFCDNNISTRKYSPWILCPFKSLFEQFRRFANLYFLVQAILMTIGYYTTLFNNDLTPSGTIAALLFTMGVTGILHLRDDIMRWRKDKETNAR